MRNILKGVSPKDAIWVVVIIVVLAVGAKFLRMFKPGGMLSQAGAEAGDKASEEVDKKVKGDPAKITKTPTELQNVAESLYQAMEDGYVGGFLGPFNVGLDKDLLFDCLKGLNGDELKEVYNKFGSRESSVFGVTMFKGNLVAWFNAVLSGDDLLKMKGIWGAAGVWS